MKKPVVIYRRAPQAGLGIMSQPHEMDRHELQRELEIRLEREKKNQSLANEREVLIYELELHQLELEIQNRELIDSQKNLSETKSKYLELYENAPIGHLTLDSKGKILEVNFACAKLLNREKVDIIGKSLSSWIAKDFKRQFSVHLNDCLNLEKSIKRTAQIELTIQKSREPIHAEFHSIQSVEPQTNKKIINIAIINLNENKKVELLENQAKEMKDERSLRENFVATLSHDLRTPLTTSKLCAQMLNTKLDDIERQKRLYHLMIEELDRADRMIKELLDANRINGTRNLPVIKKPCNLGKVALSCIEIINEIHPYNKIVSRIFDDVIGKWSKDAVQRIIENLINNAIKYGSEGTPITVSVEKKDDKAFLTVHNFGQPIIKRDQKKLFNAFHQCDRKDNTEIQGWGLGLNLVHKLVQRHSGDIKVKSNLAQGTFFTVVLPIK